MPVATWILMVVGLVLLTDVQTPAGTQPALVGGQVGPAANTALPGNSGRDTPALSKQGHPVDPANVAPSIQPGVQPGGQPSQVPHRDGVAVQQWRYQFHNGLWWYWLPEGRWVYWSNNRWMDCVLNSGIAAAGQRYSTYRLDDPAESISRAGYSTYGQPGGGYYMSRRVYGDSYGVDRSDAFRGSESFGGFSRGTTSWR